jgi:protease-4
MGAQAKSNGLVDDLGGIDSAIAILKQRAKLTGEVSLVAYPARRSLLELLTNSPVDQMADAAAESKLRKTLGFMPSPSLMRGGILQLMPYQITVK